MDNQIFLYKSPNHVGNLNNMRLSSKLCDVTIKVDDREFRAHKVILAANLKYFESMFLSSFQESKQNVVNMKGVDAINLEAFISFAYTGDILLSDRNALGLLEVANYLNEDGVKEACIEFLKKQLDKDQACRVYKFANAIDCLPLKTLARRTILSHFEDCSQTTDYLDLDCDNLKDILSDARSDLAESQKVFFEGVMKWIVHNVKNRKMHIEDLLSLIDMTQLAADYLLGYFCKSIENKDYSKITKDVMSFYRKNSQHATPQAQAENSKQTLMIVGGIDKKLHFQFYDFEEKKWSEPREVVQADKAASGYVWNCGPILKNKFYYTIAKKVSRYLQVFDPATKSSTTLSSDNRLLSFAAICTCTKYLYFCGGVNRDDTHSDQVLRYDLEKNTFDVLTPMETARAYSAAIFYQGSLHVLGGESESSKLDSVERYNSKAKKWTKLASMCITHSSLRVAALDEKLYVCGGYNESRVEVYDPSTKKWQLVAKLMQPRYDFLAVVHEGKLLAIGGNPNKSVEIYDSSKDKWRKDNEMASGLKISFGRGGLVLSSCVSNAN